MLHFNFSHAKLADTRCSDVTRGDATSVTMAFNKRKCSTVPNFWDNRQVSVLAHTKLRLSASFLAYRLPVTFSFIFTRNLVYESVAKTTNIGLKDPEFNAKYDTGVPC